MPEIELYRTVTRNLPDSAVIVVDRELRVLLAEGVAWPAGTAPAETAVGRPFAAVIAPRWRAALEPLVHAALAGETGEAELSDERERVFALRLVPLTVLERGAAARSPETQEVDDAVGRHLCGARGAAPGQGRSRYDPFRGPKGPPAPKAAGGGETGRTPGCLIVCHDVTQERRLEVELRRSQRLEAVGTLASRIAHDYNNLLMGMLGCADVALRFVDLDSRARPFLEELKRAALRGGALTRQLLVFSRRGEAAPTLLRLDAVVEESERMLHTVLGDAVDLKVSLGAGTGAVHADAGRLQQVLMNLVLNASDALPDGGTVAVSTREERFTASDLGRPAGLVPGSYAVLSVADDGVGMAPEVRARAFEPYFTTKGPGRGTGLGLASVHAIVQQAGGHVAVTSELGAGTVVRVYLPRAEPATPAVSTARAGAAAGAAGQTVLVVDDEPLVRLTLRSFLGTLGYRVFEACDHAEAALVCRRPDVHVDVLLTDVMLPGASGAEVARLVAGRFAAVRVVFMSAHPGDVLVDAGRVPEGAAFLEKPFDEDALAAAVGRALVASPFVAPQQ